MPDLQVAVLSDTSLRLLFLTMGMGTLFAYNALISCTDYFDALNPNVANVSGQMVTYQLSAMFIMTLVLLPLSTFANHDTHELQMKILNQDSPQEKKATIRSTFCYRISRFTKCLVGILDLTIPVKRIFYGFIITFVFLLVYILLPAEQLTAKSLNTFSVFVGIADATSQSGLYVLAANYIEANHGIREGNVDLDNQNKPVYTAAATLGAALSGFVVSVLRIVTKSWYDNTTLEGLRKGADLLMFLAFAISFVLILSVLVIMRDLERRQMNYALVQTRNQRARNHLSGLDADMLKDDEDSDDGGVENVPQNKPKDEEDEEEFYEEDDDTITRNIGIPMEIKNQFHPSQFHSPPPYTSNDMNHASEAQDPAMMRQQSSTIQQLGNIYLNAFRLTWRPIVSAFLNFFITLSLFPGVVVDIESMTDEDKTGKLGNWLAIVLITMFNGGDCLGRVILSFESLKPFQLLMARNAEILQTEEWDETQDVVADGEIAENVPQDDGLRTQTEGQITLQNYNWLVWYPTFGRILFYFLIAICIVPSEDPWIRSDIWRCILIFIFGVSNGFVHTANFSVAPTLVYSEECKNAVSLLLLLAIYSGLTNGAFFGLAVHAVIRKFDLEEDE
ncbi:hypothetical protein CTEN210_09008 [Chaetoceros tenuissimus]|uniref:Uncharacterized protein n=1 Tax=Chaetoceros tenuissimus TaxID=426638 RepID=A0AAD3H6L5_9STRA|nr:hypothetical protein CTEN210_09008 [Chaetoceros tenuissimus]